MYTALEFKNWEEFYKKEADIWNIEDIKNAYDTVNQRFEEVLLRSLKVRDEVRRGVRISDEEIEISIYQWINRFLPKLSRYKYVDDVKLNGIKGRLICDLFERHIEFEPMLKLKEFTDLVIDNLSDLAKDNNLAKYINLAKDIREQNYFVFEFGTNNSDLLALNVKNGIKTATSSLYEIYQLEKSDIPKSGDISIVLYSNKNVCCVIKNIDVRVVPFCDVSREHAFCEGEGDKGMSYWSIGHHVFFNRELKEYNKEFSTDMPIVLERFEKIFEPEDIYRLKGKWNY